LSPARKEGVVQMGGPVLPHGRVRVRREREPGSLASSAVTLNLLKAHI